MINLMVHLRIMLIGILIVINNGDSVKVRLEKKSILEGDKGSKKCIKVNENKFH